MNKNEINHYLKWNKYCKKQRIIEFVILGIIGLLIIFGIFSDLIYNQIFEKIDSNTILTVLQMQASISAITIALVSLIAGSISEDCYGISVVNYYLNIKPKIFKQIIIIIGTIVMVILSMVAFLVGAYKYVVCSFLISCFIIIVSVEEIFSAFKGNKSTTLEIKAYLDYKLFDMNVPFEEKANTFLNYVKYWTSLNQNKIDYENEKARYSESILKLLEMKPDYALKIIQNAASEIIKNFMASDINKKYRGIEIFEETYNKVWYYIVTKNKHICEEFNLYLECEEDIISGLYELKTSDFESFIYWERITDLICGVNIYCHKNNITDIESLTRYTQDIKYLPSTIGQVLSEKRKKGENISVSHWKYIRNNMFIIIPSVPKNIIDEYRKIRCQFEFAYYESLIRTCQSDIAGMILKNVDFKYTENKYEKVLFTLLVLCYTYYLAEREGLDCISAEEKKTAEIVLNIQKDDDTLLNLIYAICWEDTSIDSLNLYEDLRKFLESYERMPEDMSAKFCVIDKVIKDFIIFIVVISGVNNINNKLCNIITTDNANSLYATYLGNKYSYTEKLFNQMLQIFFKDSLKMKETLKSRLDNFNNEVLKKYKIQILKDAKTNYDVFLNKNLENNWTNENEKIIYNYLQNKSNEWFIKPDQLYSEENIPLLHLTTPIEATDIKYLDHMLTNIETCFLQAIIYKLHSMKMLNWFVRERSNEDIYLLLYKNKEWSLIGPDSVFEPYDYRKRKEFDDFTENCNRVNMGYGMLGVLIEPEGLPVSLNSVSISCHHKTLEECDYKIEEETGLYIFEPITGIEVKYTKEELEEYIFNAYIVIDISVKLNIKPQKITCGYVIEKRKTIR